MGMALVGGHFADFFVMKKLAGRTAILTGASGGLGSHLVRALAAEHLNLLLVAFPGVELPKVQAVAAEQPVRAEVLTADLRVASERSRVIETALQIYGRVDLLINNAGVEYSAAYHELAASQIAEVLAVNLEAPMLLSWQLLPHLLGRKQGHIVNISSLAGKAGPGFQEPYAASKAGLVAFTQSLRATYRGTGVSASVVIPGFIEAGIYSRLKESTGRSAPALLGACSPERVCRAVFRAIREDRPEVIVNRYPVRPLLALSALSPRFGEWFNRAIGVTEFFRQAAKLNRRR
jgi:short-subunit dehydrogenase